MTIPDSHTYMFTRVPRAIEKTWSLHTRRVGKDNIEAEPGTAHSYSVINNISFKVEFNDNLTSIPEVLDETADIECDHLSVWQSIRRDWASLEMAIQDAIGDLTKSHLQRASQAKMRTVDVLGRVSTRPRYEPQNTAPYRPTEESIIAPLHSTSRQATKRIETIHPNESASVMTAIPDSLSSTQMRQMLDELMKQYPDDTERKSRLSKGARGYEYVHRRRRQ